MNHNTADIDDHGALILAAEDCDLKDFPKYHTFSKSDEKIVSKLMSHGPVLLRGGRGSGKSALMLEAFRRLKEAPDSALGVYLSMRHLELLRSKEAAYENFLCKILIQSISAEVKDFTAEPTVSSIQLALSELSSRLQKRIVLLFDDAAHIGREASLAEFFDTFRTISSSSVSCKAAIYPGVTRFGVRFDVYNDATVIDVSRNEQIPGFADFFCEVMTKRYPSSIVGRFGASLTQLDVAGFMGRAVLGNMRAFIFLCNILRDDSKDKPIGLQELNAALLSLAANYYWPLLEELEPKLGVYRPMIPTAMGIAEKLFGPKIKDDSVRTSVIIHRDIRERLAKPFEILEYAGFIALRDASRAMKSGGRGSRYALNLCNLLEKTHGSRLTKELFEKWSGPDNDPAEQHRGGEFSKTELPLLQENGDLEILSQPIDTIRKSKIYPYGLTDDKYQILKTAGITTIGELAGKTPEFLDALPGIGEANIRRIQSVVGQAIWM